MARDPEMMHRIYNDPAVRWVGEQRYIIAYSVANKAIYNLSSVQPDVFFAEAPSATYTTRGSESAMPEVFQDLCPLIQRMFDMVPEDELGECPPLPQDISC